MDTDNNEPYRTADVHEYVHLIINEVAPEYEPEFGYRYDIPSSEWYAMLCVYHLTEEYCIKAHPVLEAPIKRFRRIADIIRGKDAYIIAKCEGRRKEMIDDRHTLRLIADTIDRICRVQERRWDPAFTGSPVLLHETEEKSISSRIAFAANRYRYLRLFDSPNIAGKRSKGVSVNKKFFISQVLHLTKIAVNDSFLIDEEALKGVLNKYGDEDFSDTFSSFYSR